MNKQRKLVGCITDVGEFFMIPDSSALNISVDELIATIGEPVHKLYTEGDDWIDIKVTKPQDGQTVLVYNPLAVTPVFEAMFLDNKFYLYNADVDEYDHLIVNPQYITHWQPMPIPPTES